MWATSNLLPKQGSLRHSRRVASRALNRDRGMATQDLDHRLSDPQTRKLIAFDRGEGYGSIGLVLLVALVLVGAAVGYLLVGRGNAPPYVLAILSVLAVVGVFSLFAGATGFLRPPGRGAGPPAGRA